MSNFPKICIFILSFLLSAIPLLGKDFEVLYTSSADAVSIEGRNIQLGDHFNETSILCWKDDRQVIKAGDVETGKQYIICAKSINGQKDFSLSDYFLVTKPLMSRDGPYDSLWAISSAFNGIVAIDGSLSIPTTILQDEDHFFYLACQFPEGIVNKAIEPNVGFLILSVASIFQIDGKAISPLSTQASLYYYDKSAETSTLVSDSILLVPVP